MTLTVVVGNSGSGKTTLLNDVHKSHKCTYIRQYHNIRPYVIVSKIPNFDPKGLPFWDIYERENKAETVCAGGTMAGKFTAGLSGGQRKLLLFELIYQRFQDEYDLLVVLDEPFAGVTDDFVPFIVKRLNELRQNNNILLVTNDHIETLKNMADNTITVSALDRTTITINNRDKVDREKAILALAVGDPYVYEASWEDLKFFVRVELASDRALLITIAFALVAFGLFLASYWDSEADSIMYILVAGGFVGFFAVNPYLLALSDWRVYMSEEAEALLHSSKELNKFLKSLLTLSLIVGVSVIEFIIVNTITDVCRSATFLVAMLMDLASLTFPFIALGLYSELPFTLVQVLSAIPFSFMLFFSTTFSPGSGVEGLKGLRYLFSRFYYWCMIPGVRDEMEGCPTSSELNLALLVVMGLLGVFVFLLVKLVTTLVRKKKQLAVSIKKEAMMDSDFVLLQVELYGEHARELFESRHSKKGNNSTHSKK